MALCSLSTGRSRAPQRLASSVTSAPAHTSASLLASATRTPRRTAAMVGANPAAPTIAAMTQSDGRAAASTTAAAPAPVAMPLPASASFSSPYCVSSATTAKRAPSRRACSARRAAFLCATSASTWYESGSAPSSSTVLRPTEPVEPRTVTRRGRSRSLGGSGAFCVIGAFVPHRGGGVLIGASRPSVNARRDPLGAVRRARTGSFLTVCPAFPFWTPP